MGFPPMPVPNELLIDDSSWHYPSATSADGRAHLRLWSCVEGGFLAIVTETGQGTSITNNIEDIWASLAHRYRWAGLVLIEHWPASHDGGNEEHLDQVVIRSSGRPDWRRIWPTRQMTADLAAFHAWMDAHGRRLLAAEPR